MDRIAALRSRIPDIDSLERVPPETIAELRSGFPNLPIEYLQLLDSIGWGTIGGLQVYEGPVESTSVYSKPKSDLSHILLIGDDMQGYCYGFDTRRGCALVEVDPRGLWRYLEDADCLALVGRFLAA